MSVPTRKERLAYKVPNHTLDGIRTYVEDRLPPGGFLRAVLSNNLHLACLEADDWNREALPDIVTYLHWEVPSSCWGSPELVEKWLEGET